MVKILVACEFSGAVRDAFEAQGHDAWSCDLLAAKGKHIKGDIRDVLHERHPWDLMIAHPPCTHLAVSGARWFKDKLKEQAEALEFVQLLLDAAVPRIALENPVSIISSRIRKPDQIIQPWMFGHNASKATCLWLKNLPKLEQTNVVEPDRYVNGQARYANQTDSGQNRLTPSDDRWAKRSETYAGIAEAMATQWGNLNN